MSSSTSLPSASITMHNVFVFVFGFCTGVLVLAALAQLQMVQFVTVKDVLAVSPSIVVLVLVCANLFVLDILILLLPCLLALLSPPVRFTVQIIVQLSGLIYWTSVTATTRLILAVAVVIQGGWEAVRTFVGRSLLAAVRGGLFVASSTKRVVSFVVSGPDHITTDETS
ncbi:hypothetical protein FB45DRAFT_915343, partial [Roridomyces roridus]